MTPRNQEETSMQLRSTVLFLLAAVLFAAPDGSAGEPQCQGGGSRLHFDLGSLATALGSAAVFDPRTQSGLTAFSNGDQLGPVVWESLSLAEDVELRFGDGTSAGLQGTLLVDPVGAAPGGFGGTQDPADAYGGPMGAALRFRRALRSPGDWS
jgi:hypothetical protein